jgi:dienelactone hydrolase
MKSLVPLAALSLIWSTAGQAKVHTETVEYRHGETVLEGYVAYDDALTDARPGVAIVHEWYGVGPHVKASAEKLAQAGYVAFAIDMYGRGVRPASNEEAAKQAGIYRSDRALMRARAQAGLAWLAGRPNVDPKRLAAIGYCFGGGTALELARSGADLRGVVCFHGNLDTPEPADARNIKGKVLVCHGADDPYVPAEQIAKFQEEMRSAGVDWEMNFYGGAVHSFTNPDAGSDPSKGAAYKEAAARRSWQAMLDFLAEIFG